MRKIFAFLPAVLFGAGFCYLTVMIRAFIPLLFVLVVSFAASGVFLCLEKHIPALLFGMVPAVYLAVEGLTVSDPASSGGSILLWIAGGIVLFYICYYTAVYFFHRELNRE